MSILPAMQRAALRVAGVRPTVFFESTNTLEQEFVDLVNEVGHDVMKQYDWQALVHIHTVTADGTQTVFPIPDDYDRMPLISDIAAKESWFWNYYHCKNYNEFMAMQATNFTGWPGVWIMRGNSVHFAPAPAGDSAFPYVSKNYAIDGGTLAPKPEFTSDTDEFVLDNNLLTLGLVWRWREQKKLDSSADQENFMKAVEQDVSRDGGSGVIRMGRRPSIPNLFPAWPTRLGF